MTYFSCASHRECASINLKIAHLIFKKNYWQEVGINDHICWILSSMQPNRVYHLGFLYRQKPSLFPVCTSLGLRGIQITSHHSI